MKTEKEKGKACGCQANLKKTVQNMVDEVENHSEAKHEKKQHELNDVFENKTPEKKTK